MEWIWVGVIWSAISAVGLGYYLSLFRKAWGDVRFLNRNDINSVRLTYAHMRAYFYGGLGIVQLIYLTVGVLYITDPRLHIQTGSDRGVAALTTRLLLFSTTIILAIVAIYTDRLRDRLVNSIRVIEEEPDKGRF